MDNRRPTVQRQSRLQVFYGAGVITFGERSPAHSKSRRDDTRLNCQRSLEERLGLSRSILVEVQVPEPGERSHFIRPDLQRSFEEHHRVGRTALQPVDVGQEIRPADLTRRELMSVQKTRLRI